MKLGGAGRKIGGTGRKTLYTLEGLWNPFSSCVTNKWKTPPTSMVAYIKCSVFT